MQGDSAPSGITDGEIRVDLRPRRRQDQLVVVELDDETTVYDKRTTAAHVLNATTAAVWKLCDGRRSVPEIAARLERERGIPAGSGAVWLALHQLGDAGLLERPAAQAGVTVSRRALLSTLAAAGLAAAAVPALGSINVPAAAAQVFISCRPGTVPINGGCFHPCPTPDGTNSAAGDRPFPMALDAAVTVAGTQGLSCGVNCRCEHVLTTTGTAYVCVQPGSVPVGGPCTATSCPRGQVCGSVARDECGLPCAHVSLNATEFFFS